MKKLALAIVCTLTVSSVFAQQAVRLIPIKDDWSFLSCRQMENGGVTIQRRNLAEGAEVKVYAPAYSVPTYEIYVDGNLEASCNFITVK